MYQITVEQHFDAAHFLRGYQGKCEALHGHRFRVVVKIRASRVDDIGIAYDFVELKQHLGDIVAKLDPHALPPPWSLASRWKVWRLQAILPLQEAHPGDRIEGVDEHITDIPSNILGSFFSFV